jgi:hypothetical protein
MFDFFIDEDPDWGFVEFVNHETAVREGLFKTDGDKVYIGVDSKNIVDESAGDTGRKSVRLHSKKRYTHGLFILDLDHMPGRKRHFDTDKLRTFKKKFCFSVFLVSSLHVIGRCF